MLFNENALLYRRQKLSSFLSSRFLAFLWFKVFRNTFGPWPLVSVPGRNPFSQLWYRALVFCSSLYWLETVVVVVVGRSARCICADACNLSRVRALHFAHLPSAGPLLGSHEAVAPIPLVQVSIGWCMSEAS